MSSNFINKLLHFAGKKKTSTSQGKVATQKISSAIDATIEPIIIPRNRHHISRNDINENALKVLYRLKNAGYDALLVGGSVRDLLLGGTPKDFDVVTDATPEQIRDLFSNGYIIGRRFRLVHVRFRDDIIEVATFRGTQNKKDSQKKQNRHQYRANRKHLPKGMLPYDNTYGSQSEDAIRRDFSINALYYNIKDFSVIDYTGGTTDLKNKCIRTIGTPSERYREDPVRMIRAIRFAAKLNFTLDPKTAEPIPELAHLLENVSNTRLFLETVKLFYTGCAENVFKLSREYGIFKQLFPETEAILSKTDSEGLLALDLLTKACQNTDQRYKDNLPLSAGFLFAVMLWPVFQAQMKMALENLAISQPKKLLSEQAHNTAINHQVLKATKKTIKAEISHIDLPTNVTEMITDIWKLQYRMQESPRRSTQQRILNHSHFKAAYDFLLLRAKTDEHKIDKLARRWTTLYESSEKTKKAVLYAQTANREAKEAAISGEAKFDSQYRYPHRRHPRRSNTGVGYYRAKQQKGGKRTLKKDKHGDIDGNF